MKRKAISPVVATALLLVVAVLGVVSFQSWFGDFSSSIFTDTETRSSTTSASTKIEALLGKELFFRNANSENITITQVKINGEDCFLSGNYTTGTFSFDVSDCLPGNTTQIDTVVFTNKGIFESEFFLSLSEQVPFDCSTLSGSWIRVPGNPAYGVSSFCVMKYEAKNVGGIPTSQVSLSPWDMITWQNAQSECSSLGSNYHLITDNEWLTIAKNLEQVSSNWNSSVVGSGFIFSGHNDNSPGNSLAADSDDNNGYSGTGDSSPSNQRRTLTLSNGEVIWDFSGNVWEWVNDSLPIASRYHGGDQNWMSYNSNDGTGNVASNVPSSKAPSSGWNANQGMGRYFDGSSLAGTFNNVNEAPDSCTGLCSPTVTFLRGGSYTNGNMVVGLFALNFYYGPSFQGTGLGFRCSYSP